MKATSEEGSERGMGGAKERGEGVSGRRMDSGIERRREEVVW